MIKTEPEEIVIREARIEDLRAILRLIAQHRAADAQEARWTYREFFRKGARPRDRVFVAEKAGRIVGVSGFWYDLYTDNGVYWLNWTYVHPRQRSQGVGGKLLTKVLSALRKKRARKLFADTSSNPSYHRALQFYRAHGFKREGTLRDYYEPGEDQIIFGKEL